MIVIDTQALVWMIEGDPRLGRGGRQLIDKARAENGALIAPVTVWEVAMLTDKGRLILGRPVAQWFDHVLSFGGFLLEPMSVSIAIDAGTLPGSIHGDPADRLIIATARSLGCPLLTADRKILDYAAAGHVRTIDARH